MDTVALFEIGLKIFEMVAEAANKKGLTDLASATGAALIELRKVKGTPVTKAQLESLRG